LGRRRQPQHSVTATSRSVQFGEKLRNAMVVAAAMVMTEVMMMAS
jgi:hypothetical protein